LTRVLNRPLTLLSALSVGDYLLWNWSLGGDHAVIALVSGLTLPPLAMAFVWLLALNLVRLFASGARESRLRSRDQRRRGRARRAGEPADEASRRWEDEQASTSSSSKLAA
jgi:hypothetical protein